MLDISMADIEAPKIKELGRGAFGVISSATWQGEHVAVKQLLLDGQVDTDHNNNSNDNHSEGGEPEEQDPEERIEIFNEFRREVWLMSQLKHPNVVNLKVFSILFYSTLFYSILFYSILFYSILFYSILSYPILLY